MSEQLGFPSTRLSEFQNCHVDPIQRNFLIPRQVETTGGPADFSMRVTLSGTLQIAWPRKQEDP